MREILHTYLKKSDTFVHVTSSIFLGMPAMVIIPIFVGNFNLMATLQVFIFSVWFSLHIYRHKLLKNNE
jgi:hypothetical protein